MIIRQKVTECDFTGEKYSNPVDGVGYIARGATGRHCVVMWGGPKKLLEEERYGRIKTIEEVEAQILLKGGPMDYLDV